MLADQWADIDEESLMENFYDTYERVKVLKVKCPARFHLYIKFSATQKEKGEKTMKTKTMTVKAARRNKFSKRCKFSILTAVTVAVMCCLCSMTAFASGAVDSTAFITTAGTVLRSVIILIGGGVGVWGVVNLLEGYGNDNAGAKSQGMKQLMAGLGLILLGIIMVPVLINMMSSAV